MKKKGKKPSAAKILKEALRDRDYQRNLYRAESEKLAQITAVLANGGRIGYSDVSLADMVRELKRENTCLEVQNSCLRAENSKLWYMVRLNSGDGNLKLAPQQENYNGPNSTPFNWVSF